MYEILLQESYTEWVVPLAIAIMWILSLQLFSLSHPVGSQDKFSSIQQKHIALVPSAIREIPCLNGLHLTRTVRRKECPDDTEGPHSSILKK